MNEKECYYCEESLSKSNFSKHQNKCYIKKNFNLPKSKILILVQNGQQTVPFINLSITELEEENKILKTEILLLKDDKLKLIKELNETVVELTNIKKDIFDFRNITEKYTKDQTLSVDEILSSFNIDEAVKKDYIRTFNQYNEFLITKGYNLTVDSANAYLKEYYNKNPTSTVKKKRQQLQIILKKIFKNDAVKLNKFKVTIKPKYSLNNLEINNFFNELKNMKRKRGDILAIKLHLQYGLRINSLSSLKVEHLDFIDNPDNNMIIFPDSKKKDEAFRYEKAHGEVKDLLLKYVKKLKLKNDNFLFIAGAGDEITRRNTFCQRINRLIKKSQAIPKTANYKYSSHMFRKTKANKAKEMIEKKAISKARKSIGQAKNSRAIKYYLKSNNTM